MNLLILVSDEHRRDAMGCAGHAIVKTPALDRLAADGVRFANAYTPSPMCVPTRAAIATGDYIHRTGHWDSAAPYAGEPQSWMHDLREGGCATVSIGKLHYRSAEDDNGWSEEILPMHVHKGVGWTRGLIRGAGQNWPETSELAADVGTGWSDYADYDRQVVEAAETWLASNARKGPWALWVSMVSPHYPLTAPPEFMEMYDPARMDLPTGYGSGTRPDHPELRELADFYDYDRHFDEGRMREGRAAYYALTSYMDANVARVMTALDATGVREETLVIYASDHGDMLGDHGFWTKQVMYDASAGAPLIAAGPGMPVGRVRQTATSLLDIHPTARATQGQGPDALLPGTSLIALANSPDDPDRTVFSEYHDGGSTTGAFMVRWGRWKYVHYAGMAPQLFDMIDDPAEMRDLAADPNATEALAEGRRRLFEICDPEAVSAEAFADQKIRIKALGGVEACSQSFGHTPTPRDG